MFRVIEIVLPSLPLQVMESCFPGDGWIPTCTWKAVKEFFTLLCLCAQLFLYLWDCIYLKPRVFSVLISWFSPPSHPRGVSKCLCGAQLLDGVKSWHVLARSPVLIHRMPGQALWNVFLQISTECEEKAAFSFGSPSFFSLILARTMK